MRDMPELDKDETARPGKAAHVALLPAIGHEFVLEGLASKHDDIVFLSMSSFNGIGLGMHDVVELLFRLGLLTIDQLTLYETRTAFAARALDPALNGRVCRASDQRSCCSTPDRRWTLTVTFREEA